MATILNGPSPRDFIGTILLGLFTGYLLVPELAFGLRAKIGSAEVTYAQPNRSGQWIAEVVHVVNGKPVTASLKTWYRGLRIGQSVAILYRPDDPAEAKLVSFWQRYFASALAVMALGAMAVWEVRRYAVRARAARAPASLLRD